MIMGGVIKCCIDCKPPKRHPGCHDHCPEYIGERAEHDERKAVFDKQRQLNGNLTAQRLSGIDRAKKKRKLK